MGEILPDGSIQGYTGYCHLCGATIKTNIQGDEISSPKHDCKVDKINSFISAVSERAKGYRQHAKDGDPDCHHLSYNICWEDLEVILRRELKIILR